MSQNCISCDRSFRFEEEEESGVCCVCVLDRDVLCKALKRISEEREALEERLAKLRAERDGFELACKSLSEDRDAAHRRAQFHERISLGGEIVTTERALKSLGPREVLTRLRLEGQIAGMKARKLELDALDLRCDR